MNRCSGGVSSTAPGYQAIGPATKTRTGFTVPLKLKHERAQEGLDLYGRTIRDLVFSVAYETSERLHVKIADKHQNQVPVPDSRLGMPRPILTHQPKQRNYRIYYTEDTFGFKVVREKDDAVIFDTTSYPLVFEDQYLEISTSVPASTNLYGFGETTLPTFRRDTVKNVTAIYARDAACPFYENVYGAHPFYMEIRDGKAHGALLLNVHGQDVITTEGRITWKIIGGVLDFYFFLPDDNKPNSVLRSYTDLIGKPTMISHWMLGFNQCRWGYKNIQEVEDIVQSFKDHKIPLETVWIDIDYMDTYRDFTLDPVNFPEDRVLALNKRLHDNKQRMVVMVDVAKVYASDYPPFVRGEEMNVWLRNPDDSYYVGQVWPGYSVYPDWFHPNASAYWVHEIDAWMSRLDLDGLWVDMNEPATFCLGSCGTGLKDVTPESYEPWTLPQARQEELAIQQQAALEAMAKKIEDDNRNLLYPKYAIHYGYGNLSVKTAATIAKHHGGIYHYDVHSLYGHSECVNTNEAMVKRNNTERPFLLTRSSFVGSGQYAGHWTGDNSATWDYLSSSIAEIFNSQMFGMTFSGSDICGFYNNATEQLCTRWQELGSFYPFARNHNAKGYISQAPYVWNSTAEATRIALSIRYALLPYYYTLFDESHRMGTGVWRPLIFEYPSINAFADNHRQILVGTDILVSPVLKENATTVEDAQFPPGLWYSWYTSDVVVHGPQTRGVTLDAPLTHIPVHVRGGSIVPIKRDPRLLVDDTYASPYALLVALDSEGSAAGRLYIDDGHSINQPAVSNITFTFEHNVLRANGQFEYARAEALETIKIIGTNAASRYTEAVYRNKIMNIIKTKEHNVAVLENAGIDLTVGPFSVRFQ
ncbi:alpha glucosidase [Dichotomocladium elegans]|nr:alpha glucosidase [Dichotomocladium elegans]